MIGGMRVKQAFIFDIDGTLALRGERSPYDLSRVKDDKVNPPVLTVLRALRAQGFSILIFTGRDASSKQVTVDWLTAQGIRYGPEYDLLLMRAAGSQEKDHLVKLRMLGKVREQFEVMGVFEDRKRVKRMWEGMGVFVFDVNQRDEEY